MHKEIRSFVLRRGKMSSGQRQAYENLKEKWMIPFAEEPMDFNACFQNKKVTLEIGFGMGDATWQIAAANPERGFLGVEVHTPGVGKLLSRINEANLSNLFIIEHDVVKVLDKMIPGKSLEAVHVFFPDPWPKKKHHKRRLLQEPFLSEVLDRVASGGYLYMVTDWQPYAVHIEKVMQDHPLVVGGNVAEKETLAWRPETAFEKKGLNKNHNIFEFYYIKK